MNKVERIRGQIYRGDDWRYYYRDPQTYEERQLKSVTKELAERLFSDFDKATIAANVAAKRGVDVHVVTDEWDLKGKVASSLGDLIAARIQGELIGHSREDLVAPVIPAYEEHINRAVALVKELQEKYQGHNIRIEYPLSDGWYIGFADILIEGPQPVIIDIKTTEKARKNKGKFKAPLDHISENTLTKAAAQIGMYKLMYQKEFEMLPVGFTLVVSSNECFLDNTGQEDYADIWTFISELMSKNELIEVKREDDEYLDMDSDDEDIFYF